ncbi:hypothetical protein WJX73_010171 [Symbiochloris irregularis]|uniref:Uncharacterized protein n=1 Tax=Symbiochloris irregularis TaxID=706552 RepID=A0AAW1PEX4_9CHLO
MPIRVLLRRVLKLELTEEEVPPVSQGFLAFFLALGAYFLVRPLADDAAATLGTAALPKLFVSTLVLTLLATPVTSLLLSRRGVSRPKSVAQIFRVLAASLAGFYLLQKQSKDRRAADASKTTAQRAVRGAFYIWLSVLNLVASSLLWACMADAFSSGAALRVFGCLGGGATCGQLAGSLLATISAHSLLPTTSPAVSSAGSAPHSPSMPQGKSDAHSPPWHAFFEGFRLTLASPYLLHTSAYLASSAAVSALLYFERAMVVAEASDQSHTRMAIFAKINSASALAIMTLQLLATGRMLKILKVPWALAASPLIAAIVLAVAAVHPSLPVIAAAEVLRKVVQYTLGKPAREALYTVVQQEEKYKAKLCIDTLMPRVGDTLAGGMFHILDTRMHLGPSGLLVRAEVRQVAHMSQKGSRRRKLDADSASPGATFWAKKQTTKHRNGGISLQKFAGAKLSTHNQQAARAKQQALAAGRVNKYRKLKRRLGSSAEPSMTAEQIQEELRSQGLAGNRQQDAEGHRHDLQHQPDDVQSTKAAEAGQQAKHVPGERPDPSSKAQHAGHGQARDPHQSAGCIA